MVLKGQEDLERYGSVQNGFNGSGSINGRVPSSKGVLEDMKRSVSLIHNTKILSPFLFVLLKF